MELNGVINLGLIIKRLCREGRLDASGADQLEQQCTLLDKYMTAYFYCNDVWWHEILANPELYPKGAEVNNHMMQIVKDSKESTVAETTKKQTEKLKELFPKHVLKKDV